MFYLQPLLRQFFSLRRECSTNLKVQNPDTPNEIKEKKILDRPQVSVKIDEKLLEDIKSKYIHPRKHPGANQLKVVSLPDRIISAVQKAIGEHPPKKLCNNGKELDSYLKARHRPSESWEIKIRARDIQAELEAKMNVDLSQLDNDQLDAYKSTLDREIKKTLKDRTFAWKPLDYNDYRSRMYLFGRGAQDYASIMAVLKEINSRDPTFKPRSFFDFGSGVGTGTWAVSSYWKDSIFEYYNVDTSRHMNDLAELILKDGDENKNMTLKNVYYRQFLGAPNVRKFYFKNHSYFFSNHQ